MPTIGFKYLFGIHMGVSRGPADELLEVRVGDKTAWRGSVTDNDVVPIAAPELFGGTSGEGGVEGNLTCLFGGDAQTAPTAMTDAFGGPLPGFRGAFTLFFDGMISAMNPYPKPWSFRFRRALKGWDGTPWYPEKCVISIVRPVASGEVANGSTEATTIKVSTSGIPPLASGGVLGAGPWEYTIVSDEPVTAVVEIYVETGYNSEGNSFERYVLIPGTDYTVAANVVTFVAGTFVYDERPVFITYSKDIQTAVPIGETLGSTLIQAMNPAHIIYECMTNRQWGRGLPRDRLDDDAFRQVADVLFSEGFGLCLRWRRRDEIKVFVQSVLDHVGAVMYTSRTTGLLVLRLIRADYDQSILTLYDSESGLLEITEASISSAGKMISELRVTYRDPVTNEDRVVRSSNLAATRSTGGTTNMLSKEYPGVPTAELASRVAKRDLRGSSPKLRRFSLTFDRRADKLTPGGVVRIQDLPRNVPDMVLRIATIDYGSNADGRIKVQAVQDVFDTPRQGFTVIGPPAWIPPPQRACVGNAILYELPYRTLYRKLNTADFAFVDSGSAYLGLAQDKGTGSNANGLVGMAVKYGTANNETEYPSEAFICGFEYVPQCDLQWSDVVMLCNFEGPSSTTTPTVYSDYGNTLSLSSNGLANTSTENFKFGGRSAKIVGNSGKMVLSVPMGWVGAPSMAPRDKDFCVEVQARFESYAAGAEIIKFGYDASTQKYSALYYDYSGVGNFYVTALLSPGVQPTVATGTGIPLGVWFHLAWDRRAGVSRIFINGVIKASWADTYNYDVDTIDIRVPASSVDGNTGVVFYDELRYTVGSSRYAANFTPPTEPFKTVPCAPIQKLRLIQPARSLPPFSILAPTALTHKVVTSAAHAANVFKQGFVRSRFNNTTVPHAGKKYCEFQIIGSGDSSAATGRGYVVGLIQDAADASITTNPLGGSSAAYFSNVNYLGETPGVGGGTGGAGAGLGDFVQNDVIGMAVDYATGKVWFRVGTGAWIGGGDPATGASASIVLGSPTNALPYMTVYARAGAQTFEVRMRAQGDTFTGTVPTGFAAYS